jgi:hypothetical protein
MNSTMRRESSNAVKFKLNRGCGAVGAHMPMHPAAAAGFRAFGRFGERGKREAV